MGLTEFRVGEVRWGSGTYLYADGSVVLRTPCVRLGRPHPPAILAGP
jgi:prepilin-type processing-associated H-X9-DG protein